MTPFVRIFFYADGMCHGRKMEHYFIEIIFDFSEKWECLVFAFYMLKITASSTFFESHTFLIGLERASVHMFIK